MAATSTGKSTKVEGAAEPPSVYKTADYAIASYRKYYRIQDGHLHSSILWNETKHAKGWDRQKARMRLAEKGASCVFFAMTELCNTLDMYLRFEEEVAVGNEGWRFTPTINQVTNIILALGLPISVAYIRAIIEPNAAGQPWYSHRAACYYQAFDSQNRDIETTLVLAVYDDDSNFSPHWLPSTSINYRRRLAVSKKEKLHLDQQMVPIADVFNFQMLAQNLSDQLEIEKAVEESDPPVPITWAIPFPPGHGFGERGSRHKHQDYTLSCGVHPPPTSLAKETFASSTRRFYWVGEGTQRAPATEDYIEIGPPSSFARALASVGENHKLGTLWELHPLVIKYMTIDSGHMAYLKCGTPTLANPHFLDNGCYNPEMLGHLQTTGGIFKLVSPYTVKSGENTFMFFSLERSVATLTGLLGRMILFHTESVKFLSMKEYCLNRLPDQANFDSKRSWLRCVFSVLASAAPDEYKALINDQRNQALSALEDGRLPESYDPVLLVKDVMRASAYAHHLVGLKGAAYALQ
jgi:hypothetical protein